MIEQGIYFALGCIITALAALMFAPLFWRRALRLTRKRLQLQIPLSMQEIRAEHDQLRATFAVERLQVEQAAEKVHAGKAADMAEIGRRDVRISDLENDLAAARLAEESQLQKLASLERDLAEHRSELGDLKTSLADSLAERDEAFAERDAAVAGQGEWETKAQIQAVDLQRLRDTIESHRTTIAGLETRAMGLEMRLTDKDRSAGLKAAEEGLRSKLEAAMSQATRHEASAISFQRENEDAKARIRTLETELDAALEHKRANRLHESLTVGRPDLAEDTNRRAPSDRSDAELRASIHALGLAVSMMTRRAAEPHGPDRVPQRADTPKTVDAN